LKGMYREALPPLEKYSALSRSSAASLALRGYLHAGSGERSQALRLIEELRAASKHRFRTCLFLCISLRRIGRQGSRVRLARKGTRRAVQSSCLPQIRGDLGPSSRRQPFCGPPSTHWRPAVIAFCGEQPGQIGSERIRSDQQDSLTTSCYVSKILRKGNGLWKPARPSPITASCRHLDRVAWVWFT